MWSILLICIVTLLGSFEVATLPLNAVDVKEKSAEGFFSNNRLKRQDGFESNFGGWPQSSSNNNNPFLNNVDFNLPEDSQNSFLQNGNGNNGNRFSNDQFSDNDFNNWMVESNRRTTQSPPTQSTVAIPGMGTTRSACENACLATTQFDPVCGDNGVTYTNVQWLRCAQRCGKNVNIRVTGACPRSGK